MRSRRAVLGQAAGLAATLTMPGVKSAQAAADKVLVIGSQSMSTLNPAIQSGNATGVPGSQLFAGLVQLDESFKPVPYLAKQWEVSKDGLEYRFTLVKDAVFHDGKPITASDVVFSVETAKASNPLMSVTYPEILDSVEALDNHTVSIRLKNPFLGLFSVLVPVLTPILPEHIYGKHAGPILTNPANNSPIGSGPYKFVEWRHGQYVILERHAEFFGTPKPYFDRLVFKIVESALSRALMLETGDLDYDPFSFIRVRDLKRLSHNKSLVITWKGYEALGPVDYLELNLRIAPFNDVRVRRAIAHAIDKDFICGTLQQGMSKRLDGPLHSGNRYYASDALVRYPYDLDKANRLLDEAGLTRKHGNIRAQFTLDVPTFEPDSMALVAEYLKTQLRRVGFDILLWQSTDLADWASRVGQWNYQMTMNSTWNWSDPVVGVDRLFLSTNIKKRIWTNTEGYSNPKVDELLTKAAAENDQKRRKELYKQFQHIVTDQQVFIWTNQGIYTTVYNKKLTNLPLGVYGALAPFNGIRLAQV